MFKKKCDNCGEKSSKDYEFCPHCGDTFYNSKEDYGMLGKDKDQDILDEFEKAIPKFMKFPFRKLIERLSKDLEKQLIDINKQKIHKVKKESIREGLSEDISEAPQGISIQIRMSPANISSNDYEDRRESQKQLRGISKEKMKKLAKLPREEAVSKLKRLSNRIVYELDMPGVKNKEDVFITRLENSIEIKAIGNKKAYFKLLPISLPIKSYGLKDGKLIINLETEE